MTTTTRRRPPPSSVMGKLPCPFLIDPPFVSLAATKNSSWTRWVSAMGSRRGSGSARDVWRSESPRPPPRPRLATRAVQSLRLKPRGPPRLENRYLLSPSSSAAKRGGAVLNLSDFLTTLSHPPPPPYA
jgi:hypothetical protein